MEHEKRYSAFISYRHLNQDMCIAERVQTLLESYRPPRGIAAGKRIGRIFRDTSELPASRDLDDALQQALLDSDFLILILSEKTKESKWCMEELRRFKEAHGGSVSRVLPVLISGEPAEVFPEELCFEERMVPTPEGGERLVRVEVEPVCADVRADSIRGQKKKLRTEMMRLAAPMLGVGFDDLYQRQRRRRRRIRSALISSGFALLLLLVGVIGTAYLRVSASERQVYRQMVLGHVEAGLKAAADGDARGAMAWYAKALGEDPDNPLARSGALLLLQTQHWLYAQGEAEKQTEETVMPPQLLTELMTLTAWPETGDGAFVFAGAGAVCVWMSDTDSCYVFPRAVDGYSKNYVPRAAPIITEDRAQIVLQDDHYMAVYRWEGDTKAPGLKPCTLLQAYDLYDRHDSTTAFDPEDEAAQIEIGFLRERFTPGLPRAELELGPCRPVIYACPGNGWVVPVGETIWALNETMGTPESKKQFSSYILDVAQSPAYPGYAAVTASRWSRGVTGNIVTAVSAYGILQGESAEDSRYPFRSLCFDNSGHYLLWADTGLFQLLHVPSLGNAAPPLAIPGIRMASVTPEGKILLETVGENTIYDVVGFRAETAYFLTQQNLAEQREQADLSGYTLPEAYRDYGEILNSCRFAGGCAVLLSGGNVLIYLDGQTEPCATVALRHGDYVNNGLAVSPDGWLCAISFSQTVSNTQEGKTSFWAVELWNWKENRFMGDLGNNRRYGRDQLGMPFFPEPNLLCYSENAGVRSILLDTEAPDAQTVQALRELAGMAPDDRQTLQAETPTFTGGLGNWASALQTWFPLRETAKDAPS